MPAYRPGSHTQVTTKLHIDALSERSHGRIRVEDDNEFSDLGPNLQAKARPASADARRPTPALWGTRYDYPFAAPATKTETDFNDRQDGQSSGVFEHGLGDTLLRHCLETFNNCGRLIDVILQTRGADRGGAQGHAERQDNCPYTDCAH